MVTLQDLSRDTDILLPATAPRCARTGHEHRGARPSRDLPWIGAANRRNPNAGAVTVINILLGWSVIGWVVALAMACRSVPSAPTLPAAAPSNGLFAAPCMRSRLPKDAHTSDRCPQPEHS
jgi:hypothetical protein